jgi:hypothetical protein
MKIVVALCCVLWYIYSVEQITKHTTIREDKMTTLKITYLDGTELPNDGGSEQIITGAAADEVLETNNLSITDLPATARDGSYRIEEN